MDDQMTLKPIAMRLNGITRLKGMLAVTVAYICVRCLSISTVCSILKVAKQLNVREIDINEAETAWGAVRQSSFFFSGRVACLELSLAFVLFALAQRRSATWCIGVASQPFRSHAWVELAGQPFHEVDHLEQDFKKLLVV